ncbi:hypothetical protein GBF38_018791, partial [Nibea albiflora]
LVDIFTTSVHIVRRNTVSLRTKSEGLNASGVRFQTPLRDGVFLLRKKYDFNVQRYSKRRKCLTPTLSFA